jgi:hypothetical protein
MHIAKSAVHFETVWDLSGAVAEDEASIHSMCVLQAPTLHLGVFPIKIHHCYFRVTFLSCSVNLLLQGPPSAPVSA